jgi:hypothetical protein
MADRVMTATEWAHVASALALWMVVPLLVGAWRIVRSELA